MERWDIYDENKQVTGRTMARNDWNMQPGDFHLTVLGVLRRPDGKYLITRRRMDKEWAPGWWEIPGGGVRAGESAEDAVKREILEETGVDVSKEKGECVFSYKRVSPAEKNNYFVDIFQFTVDIPADAVKPQEKEVMEYAFATAEEIRKYGEQGIFLHYDSMRTVFEEA
jgi:8-oxo-dGTP pyrophosphatase MutT (NUDIX family)